MRLKRTRTDVVNLVLAVLLSAGALSCGKRPVPAKRAAPGFRGPAAMSREEIAKYRVSHQEEALRENNHCPDCLTKRLTEGERALWLDAVVDCETTIRVGTNGDGGKWLCNPHQIPKSCVVYSFGVGDDSSFDTEIAGMFGCDVTMFDPTPHVLKAHEKFKAGQQIGQGKVRIKDLALGPVSDDPSKKWDLELEGKRAEVKTLADIARSLGNKRVDILKIDIEGSEFPAMREIIASRTLLALGVKELLLEIHLSAERPFGQLVSLIAALKDQDFLVYRKELNPYYPLLCAEYAFVKVK